MSESSQGPGFHPLYLQVKELLIQRVVSGDWKPGESLPSETKLAAEYQVSQGTVRKAIEEMAADHLVVRHQGKGTFVCGRDSETLLHFFSIRNEHDQIPLFGAVSMFDWSVGAPSDRDRRDLNLTSDDDEVYRIYRVRVLDGEPALSEKIILSKKRFLGLPEIMRAANRMNTYLLMEREFGVLVVRAEESIEAVTANDQNIADMKVAPGTPLLRVHRLAYALDGEPVEKRRMRIKTGALSYRKSLG